MRVLLDECVPRRSRREIPGHAVRTVGEAGWGGTKNGALLRRAEAEFDVFLTVDANIEHQQNLAAFDLAVVRMVVFSNDIDLIRPLVPQLLELLPRAEPGRLYRIGPA